MDAPFPPAAVPLDPQGLLALRAGSAPGSGVALLDVREDLDFHAGHLASSGHVPVADLSRRRTELPPRDHPVIVLADSAERARDAAGSLRDLGYASVAWLDAPLATLGPLAADRGPAARLWRPAAFLAQIVDQIPRGPAADLAAGSGRDAAFLALHGFDVEAWDESPEALAMARALAERSGVRVTTREADLESRAFALPEAAYRLVTCFRFLHRPLFATMVRALVPGGHLVYETYRVGQERFGRPRRRRFLLDRGELRREFETRGLEVLRFEEPDPEGGPITSRLWGRRPPGPTAAPGL